LQDGYQSLERIAGLLRLGIECLRLPAAFFGFGSILVHRQTRVPNSTQVPGDLGEFRTELASSEARPVLKSAGASISNMSRLPDRASPVSVPFSHDEIVLRSRGDALPIRPFLNDQVLDPETVESMSKALAEACKALRLSEREDPAVRLLAMRIIECARDGVRDIGQLKDAALKDFPH
jgi:hypothetical protein